MMGLWFFGPRVEVRLGSTRFAQLYLVAGITGALLSSALAPQAALVGASAAIFGVMLAFASFWPHEKIFIWGVFPIEARWLVVLSTLFALYASRTGIEAGVAHYAHLGGYAGAWLFLRWLDATSDARRFQRKMHEAPKIPERKLADGMRGLNLEGVHELSRAEVNRILDKIGAQGMASLTPQERTFLMNFVPPDDRKRWTS
ncbi:MAG: rhomboid family intramembrane serine protease [Gemmatimonadetes bacterium]|nr:rhomboid family intramembrane serine protease [Gemmatimonadota bacterium]